MNGKLKVAFICVHNSCRSQMAQAIANFLAADVFEAYSAGTEVKPQINQDAVRTIKELYNIDMEKTQHSKLLDELPEIDIAIKMGCDVACPIMLSRYEEDWGLEDPTGKGDKEFQRTAKIIESKILELKDKIQSDAIVFSR